MRIQITLSQDEIKAVLAKEIAKRGYEAAPDCIRFGTVHPDNPDPVYLGYDYKSVAIIDIEEADLTLEKRNVLTGCSERG